MELFYDCPRLIQVTCLEDAEVLYMNQTQINEALNHSERAQLLEIIKQTELTTQQVRNLILKNKEDRLSHENHLQKGMNLNF